MGMLQTAYIIPAKRVGRRHVGKRLRLNDKTYKPTAVCSRVTVRLGDFAIKVAGPFSEQCRRERDFWNEVKDTPDARFFAPLLEFGEFDDGHSYCVQPWFPQTYWQDIKDHHRHQLYELEARFKFEDMHNANWCVNPITNQVLIFDYAW